MTNQEQKEQQRKAKLKEEALERQAYRNVLFDEFGFTHTSPEQVRHRDPRFDYVSHMDSGNWVFRALTPPEVQEFKQSARKNYKPFTTINGVWHTIYQKECVLINHEHSLYQIPDPEQKQESGNEAEEMEEGDTGTHTS